MRNMLRDIDKVLSQPEEAVRVLLSNTDEAGTAPTMATIIQAGFLERGDPYIKNLLNLFRVNILKDLKKKAKILVPHGAFLLGVMDETGALEEGEVFVQVWDTSKNGTINQVITGDCVVFRNPCFHPGDIRVVKAVNRSELQHLSNVIVFSSKGFRDIPSMCSGGDLDGDDYTIFWDHKLMPIKRNYTAMDYTAPSPRLVEDVTISDIKKFFVNYINNDNLGQIANAHLATADASDKGALDGKCIKLAHLHSEAVDFPKSGKPAVLSDDLVVKKFPDFMQKKDKESYASTKVLGNIFRSIDKSDYKDYMSKLIDEAKYDVCMYVSGMEYYIGEARQLRGDFNRDLLGLMNQNGVQTEAEITSGYIIKWLKKGKSKTRFEQHNSTMKAVKAFKAQWRKEFEREFIEDVDKTIDPSHKSAIDAKAAAWYYVTYHPEERQRNISDKNAFLSFPWIIFDYVCEIAKKNKHRNHDPSYFLPIAEAIIAEQYERRMSSKRQFANENGDEELENLTEILVTEEEYDYDSDYSDNDNTIYGTHTGMFGFNNRVLHELSQNNNQVPNNAIHNTGQRPVNSGSNTQPVVRSDPTMEDLARAILE
ncbi:RNA dependent RNA polymerase-domain-containing protein [Sporodiniella umbellata]|nr:RNA dependent RNA polymerase-domain-containing protein [Sporodiniella umbellata]